MFGEEERRAAVANGEFGALRCLVGTSEQLLLQRSVLELFDEEEGPFAIAYGKAAIIGKTRYW